MVIDKAALEEERIAYVTSHELWAVRVAMCRPYT